MVHSLFLLKRYNEAELAAREWHAAGGTEAEQVLEILRQQHPVYTANGIKTMNNSAAGGSGRVRLDDELAYQAEFEWSRIGFQDGPRRNKKHPVELIQAPQNDNEIITHECQTNLNYKPHNQILKADFNVHKKIDGKKIEFFFLLFNLLKNKLELILLIIFRNYMNAILF